MKSIQNIGLVLFIISLLIFTAMLGLGHQQVNLENIPGKNEYHTKALKEAIVSSGLDSKVLGSVEYISEVKKVVSLANANQEKLFEENGAPEGVGEWDFRFGGSAGDYTKKLTSQAIISGPISDNPWLWFMLTFGLATFGGLLFIIPLFKELPGIKHDGIYHNSLTRGLKLTPRAIVLGLTIIGVLAYGFNYVGSMFWPLVTLALGVIISFLVFFKDKSKEESPSRSASPINTAWLGIIAGTYMIFFYVLLYWASEYTTSWTTMLNPLSNMLNGGDASQWFLYGLMYTFIVIVMGIRMLSKYQHNKYQRVRTYSVMFFQTIFAFLIPEILSKLSLPSADLKNMWPLDYSFFFDYRLDSHLADGHLGIFMLVWGIALFVVGVPLFTYLYGKRWYCSWVCGCGGLAETLGDPFRQLSDKSLRAWKYERYIIHSVLVFAIIMTALVLYTYFTGESQVLRLNTFTVRSWYGFFIGAGFAGIVGTGFYPLMGNRTWCRFGCPLAAYLGLVQRFKSRFRITTNGSQCISCGNCSTYCEMGIDVRSYAQKGQDIVRSSCVGCGVCAAVCPRGVLRLENGDEIDNRADTERVIHITEDSVGILS